MSAPRPPIASAEPEGAVPMKVRAFLSVLLLTVAFEVLLPAAQSSTSSAGRKPGRTASIAGRIVHPDGTAADGARVAVYAFREGAPAAIVATTISAHDGRYEVTGLPAGEFAVGVTPLKAGGFGGDASRPRSVPVETLYPGVTDRERAQPITVFDGVAAEGIDVWLAPAPQRFALSGRVFWPGGVEVRNLVIEYGGPRALRRGLWYVSDPGGLFTIDGVAQGTYVLLARGETKDGPLIGLASTDVSLGSVEDIRLVLRSPGAVEGRMTIEGTGKTAFTSLRVTPVQALLTLSPVYPVEDAVVAEDGGFRLANLAGEYSFEVEGLPAGWRVKRVSLGGQPAAGNRVTVGAGEQVTGVEIVIGMGST
jgi:hypothetical protein